MKCFFFRLFFLFAPIFCFGTINGLVRIPEYSGKQTVYLAVSDATVKLYQGLVEVDSTTTDVAGNYSLPTPAPGTYQLQISYIPQQTIVLSINVLTADADITNYSYFDIWQGFDTNVTVNVTDVNSDPLVGVSVAVLQNSFVYGSGVTDSSGSLTITGILVDTNTTIQVDNPVGQIFRTLYTTGLDSKSFTFQFSSSSVATISGRVTTSGVNAEGVFVQCYSGSSDPVASTTTNLTGDYSFTNLPPGTFTIIATLSGYQQGVVSVYLSEGGAENGVNINLLASPTTVFGNVYSYDTGLPIQGASLQLLQNQIPLAVFATDQFGLFVFPNCPSGELVVNASSPYYQVLSQGITLSQGEVGALNFSLPSNAFSISGIVESDGVPIDFATVSVSIGSSNHLFTYTSPQGLFSLNNLSLGSFGITVTKDGYQSVTIPVEITSTENDSLTVNLSPSPVTLSGEVTDEIDVPIAKVLLLASLDGNFVGSATTDDNGQYAFYNLPAGEVIVWTKYPSTQQVTRTYNFVPGEQLTLQDFILSLGPNKLKGGVYDALTNAPISYATVLLNQPNDPSITGYCGPVGEFTISGLNEETYSLSAQAHGYITNTAAPVTFLGLDEIIIQNIYLYPQDAPPRNVGGNIIPNNYGAGVVYNIDQITWEASESPEVVSYNIYVNDVLIGNVAATIPLLFNYHNQNITITYKVKSVNSNGSVSSSGEVTLR